MAAYIFDFDGTIADSFDYVFGYLARETQGSASQAAKHPGQYRGLSMRLMAVKLGASPWRLPFLFLKGRRQMQANMAQLKAFAGMPELIHDLHAAGHQLFLVSANLKQNIRPFLLTNGLDSYFTDIYGNAILFGKARVLRRLVRRHKLDPATTWYIGDEGADVSAAHKAGLKAAAVTWGYNNLERLQLKKPDVLAFTSDELRSLS